MQVAVYRKIREEQMRRLIRELRVERRPVAYEALGLVAGIMTMDSVDVDVLKDGKNLRHALQ